MSDWSSFPGDKSRHDKWRAFLTESKAPQKIEEIEWFGAKKRREKAALKTDRKLAKTTWGMETWAQEHGAEWRKKKKPTPLKKLVKAYRRQIGKDENGTWARIMGDSGIDIDELLEWIHWRFEKGFSDEEILKIEKLRAKRDAPPEEEVEAEEEEVEAEEEDDGKSWWDRFRSDEDDEEAVEDEEESAEVAGAAGAYKWGKNFGINSKTNTDSLLNTFASRAIPAEIANPIADLMIDLADDEGIVLEAVELVGRADEPQRTIKAGTSRELYDFLASLDIDAQMYKKVLKALNRWGRTNTVRFIDFPTDVPEFGAAEEAEEEAVEETPAATEEEAAAETEEDGEPETVPPDEDEPIEAADPDPPDEEPAAAEKETRTPLPPIPPPLDVPPTPSDSERTADRSSANDAQRKREAETAAAYMQNKYGDFLPVKLPSDQRQWKAWAKENAHRVIAANHLIHGRGPKAKKGDHDEALKVYRTFVRPAWKDFESHLKQASPSAYTLLEDYLKVAEREMSRGSLPQQWQRARDATKKSEDSAKAEEYYQSQEDPYGDYDYSEEDERAEDERLRNPTLNEHKIYQRWKLIAGIK